MAPAKKSNNDFVKKSTTKEGTSNSRLDFISGEDDISDIDDADLERESGFLEEDDFDDDFDDDSSTVDLDDETEFGDFLDFSETDSTKENKPKVTVIERKIERKKYEEPPKLKSVGKQARKLLSEYASDVSAEEIDKFLEITGTIKDQMINGPMNFTGKSNPSMEDKKEFFNKLEGLRSSDDISRVNAAFVLKWLKKRST